MRKSADTLDLSAPPLRHEPTLVLGRNQVQRLRQFHRHPHLQVISSLRTGAGDELYIPQFEIDVVRFERLMEKVKIAARSVTRSDRDFCAHLWAPQAGMLSVGLDFEARAQNRDFLLDRSFVDLFGRVFDHLAQPIYDAWLTVPERGRHASR